MTLERGIEDLAAWLDGQIAIDGGMEAREELAAYFGCREPHLPLEFCYSKLLLEREGHDVSIVDGQLENLSREEIKDRVAGFLPDFLVITTAPSYRFWRCAPPELRARQRKLGVDAVVTGEYEEILPLFARSDPVVQSSRHASDMATLPALEWPDEIVARHHHHRIDEVPLDDGVKWLRTGLSWSHSLRPAAEAWFDPQIRALEPFDVTVTYCFTPDSRGLRSDHMSPPKHPEEFAEFGERMTGRYA